MAQIVKKVKSLFDLELYSDVEHLCDLALHSSEPKNKSEALLLLHRFQLALLHADALYNTHKFQQAESLYRKSLLMRRNLLKTKSSATDLYSEVDIIFKISKCLMAIRHYNQAYEILQSIPAKGRSAKVNMALGDLCKELSLERSAVSRYKDVLKECPLSVTAAENLLKLGVKGVEVNSLMVEVRTEMSFLDQWLKAQAQLYSGDFSSAIQTYKGMDGLLLVDSALLLVNMGYCYHYMGESEEAIRILQRALRINPDLVTGRDLLSTLLATSHNPEHLSYLEKLASTNLEMQLWTNEHWVALGNCMFSTKKYEDAISFAQQVLAESRNVEALLLKARTLAELSKFQEAIPCCTEAIKMCPFRFDFHQCLVECYVKMNRLREADSMAVNACKQLNYNPDSLTLRASVLLKDPITANKTVKNLLEKAVSDDKTISTGAACMLAEFLEQEQQHEQAKQLLLKFLDRKPTSRIHQLLGNCYLSLQKHDEAFDHFNIALRLDPNNQRANEGLNSIEHNLTSSKRESYYTCVGDNSLTSLSTTTESDTDIWQANSSFN